MKIRYLSILFACLICSGTAFAAPDDPLCVVPSAPDGGFQLTCEMARAVLATTNALAQPLAMESMPGGVGAIAYNTFTSTRRAEPGSLVAFSEGSLFNLAKGKFGQHDWRDVRWVAALGIDHGAIAIQDKSPWRSLADFVEAMGKAPQTIAIGGSGTINGRDWMRVASLARLAGVDIRRMRFVAFEGGGDCITALVGDHVQACMNDAATTQGRIDKGVPVRLLTIFAQDRLPGKLGSIPTAREQGFDIVWPVIRGVYMGPDVSETDYAFWVETFRSALAQPAYGDILATGYLLSSPLVGKDLGDFVRKHAASAAEEIEPL